MILKDFFDFYFEATDPEVKALYEGLIPESQDLSSDYAAMFARNDDQAIEFLIRFYRMTGKLCRENPSQAILFNVTDNVCFPYFVRYIWDVMGDDNRERLLNQARCQTFNEVVQAFRDNVSLRNWFREQIGSSLSQEDLFTLNEIIALQNFSSGGEFSFLKYSYPHLKGQNGKVLDGGCGSGFATLVMSQYMEVSSIDACRARLERAQALGKMMHRGDKAIFPQLINLIETELGEMTVECEFPSADQLLSGQSIKPEFQVGSLDSLPYADASFDYINCLDVLEHTYSPQNIVKQFARVLKPGGKVFITAPTVFGEIEQRIWESIEGTLFPAMLHMHHFDREALLEMFGKNGFREIDVIPFDFMDWTDLVAIAEKSPEPSIAEEVKSRPFGREALQLFAVYERV